MDSPPTASRENVRANGNDKVLETTADTGDIQKLLREINGQTPNSIVDGSHRNPTPAPATRSHQKPPQHPFRGVEYRELSNLGSAKKKDENMASKDSRRLTVDASSLEALLRDCEQDDNSFSLMMQGGGQADRRATADFNLLSKLLEATPSPSAKVNARGMKSEARRETADHSLLEKLLTEMQSPRLRDTPQGRAFAQILVSSQSKSTDSKSNTVETSENRRLTIDSSVLARLLQDSSMVEEADDQQGATSADDPEPQGGAQNVTADMSILCALLNSARKTAAREEEERDIRHGEDLIAIDDRGKDEAKESSAKKGKKANDSPQEQEARPSVGLSAPRKSPTPDHKRSREEKRRTTASPTSLARLLEELDDQPQTRPTLTLSGKASPIPKDSLALLHERSQQHDSPPVQRPSPKGASPMPQGLGDTGSGKKGGNRSPRPPAEAATKAHTPFNFKMSPPPVPPRMASTDTKGKQALRSCLSTSKSFCPATSPRRVRSEKKSVVFGSPDAAFFFKNSPSNSITPMAKNDVKRLFPQFEDLAHSEDESEMEETGVTAENSAILATWDEESDEEDADSSRKKRKLSRSPRPKRRDSLLPSSGGSSKSRSSLLSKEDEEENNMDLSRLNDSRMTLNDKLDMVAESEAEAAMATNDLEEMADIGEVSPQFRSSIDKSPCYGKFSLTLAKGHSIA